MTTIEIDSEEIEIAGVDEAPVDASLKINGPPGTGKTTQGLSRVVALIENHDVDMQDVTWVTYRRSLAEDVLTRLDSAGVLNSEDLTEPSVGQTQYVSTVHAVARRIAEREELRNRDAPTWHDKQDYMLSTYSLPFESNSDDSEDYGSLIFDVYQWLNNNNLPFTAAHECPKYDVLESAWSSHPPLSEFAEEWEAYKVENGLVDFHEYLEHVRDEQIIPPTSVVVVDEYHDAYPLLDDVCRMWIDSAEVGIVLGDPQQVVNVHEGATPELFESLDLPEVKLDKTWRVPPVLWKSATDVLAGQHDPNEPAFNDDVEGDLYEVRPPQIDYNSDTEEWLSPTGEYATPDDLVQRFSGSMLFLARTRRMVTGITSAWLDAGVLFRSQVGNGWRDNDRRRHLYNALQRLRGAEIEQTSWNNYETSEGTESLMHSYEVGYLLRHTPARLLQPSRDEVDGISAKRMDRGGIVDISELGGLVTDEFWSEMTEGAQSARKLVHRQGESALPSDIIAAALERNESPTIELTNDVDNDELHEDGLDNAPEARTIHASKGSEADTAVIYDGITSTISTATRRSWRVSANEDRVWYVGLTRAKQSVVIARDVWWWADDYLPFSLTNRTTSASLPSGDSQ